MRPIHWLFIIFVIILLAAIYIAFDFFINAPYRYESVLADDPHIAKECFLMAEFKGKFQPLSALITSANSKNKLAELEHDFHHLRLICFHSKAHRKSDIIELRSAGITAVTYQMVEGKLIATGQLMDGSKIPLLIAPKELIPKKTPNGAPLSIEDTSGPVSG